MIDYQVFGIMVWFSAVYVAFELNLIRKTLERIEQAIRGPEERIPMSDQPGQPMTPPTGQKTLRDYARHDEDCTCLSHRRSDDGGWTFKFPPVPCSCGLDALLAVDPAPQAQGDFRETTTAALENLFESISERTDMLGSTTLVVPREAYEAARKAIAQAQEKK
jgi:hypothetical protein